MSSSSTQRRDRRRQGDKKQRSKKKKKQKAIKKKLRLCRTSASAMEQWDINGFLDRIKTLNENEPKKNRKIDTKKGIPKKDPVLKRLLLKQRVELYEAMYLGEGTDSEDEDEDEEEGLDFDPTPLKVRVSKLKQKKKRKRKGVHGMLDKP